MSDFYALKPIFMFLKTIKLHFYIFIDYSVSDKFISKTV